MPDNLALLTNAANELLTLRRNLPDLEIAMEHRLRQFFPTLAEDVCTDLLFINEQAPPEPGQTPFITSKTLSMLIDQCYLEQKIPAFVQGQTKVYHYAHTVEEQDQASEITVDLLEKFLAYTTFSLELCLRDALTDFWQKPQREFNSLTPKAWLSRYVTNLIRTEAAVRHADKTLDEAALNAVNQVFASPTQPPTPGTFGFYTLTLNGNTQLAALPLYGHFVITTKNLPVDSTDSSLLRVVQDDAPRTVVLFTPTQGLESFASLSALSQELNARLTDNYQRDTLLESVLVQDRVRALAHHHVDLSPVADASAQTFYADQLIHKQKLDMRHAWPVAVANGQDKTLEDLSDHVEQSLDSSIVLKPAGILQARYTRLLESQLPEWLKQASEADKSQWRLAVEKLNHEQLASEASQAQSISLSGQRNTLLGYARQQLIQRIKSERNIEVDPDSIFISTTEALQTGAVIYPFGGSGFPAGVSIERTGPSITHKTTVRSLSELALANVGVWDVTFALTARITDAQGHTHPILTHNYIKQLVRELDIGERYKTRLNDLLLNSQQAHWRKERYVALKTAQLKLDLLEARLSGVLNEDQAAWVQAVLDHPAEKDRPLVKGGQIKAQLLMLRYHSLPGLLVFTSTAVSQLLCYLPGAPKNTWFAVAHSRNELARLLSQPMFNAYVLHKVTSAQQAYIRPLLNDGLSDSNVQLQIVPHSVFEASYDAEASHALRDADEQSTSTYESNLNTAKDAALTFLDVISFVLPTKILLPIVAARFIYQLTLVYDALQRDEEYEGFLHLMGAISHLTDGASDFAGSAVFGRSIRQRARQPLAALNPNAASSPLPQTLRLRTGNEYGSGVYEGPSIGGSAPAHFIKDNKGNLYRSHYDNLDDTWRVSDERAPDAQRSVPVSELSAGRWDVHPASPQLTQRSGIERVIDSAKVTGVRLSGRTPDAQGVYRVANLRYIEQNGIVFEVSYGWLGRHWYLQLPAGSSTLVRYKVRRTQGYWEIKHRLSSAEKRWEPLIRDKTQLPARATDASYSVYDLPVEHRTLVQELIAGNDKLLHVDYASPSPELQKSSQTFKALRAKLLTDAQTFLKAFEPKPRPVRPSLAQSVTPDDLFKSLFEQSQGVILGETHSQQSAKKILIAQMSELKKREVGVIFLEHLQTDTHQSLLDEFFSTQKMPPQLDEFLKSQDAGHQIDPSSEFTYSKLVREAVKQRIPVKALDCTASYHVSGMPTRVPDLNRTEMFSYFASQVIRGHLATNPTQKWIALTGNSHANTYQGVPGIAELEGAIGVRVSDAAPNNSHGLRQNIPEIIAPSLWQREHVLLKNDYWLEVDIAGTKPKLPPFNAPQIESKLNKPGTFMLENTVSEGAYLIHRARDQHIVRTRIQLDNGTLFIDRPNWPDIHLKRYHYLADLVRSLKARGLEAAS